MTRIERLTSIVLLLQERGQTASELAERLGVSRRTVIRDVQSLGALDVPVISREGVGGGYELSQEFRLPPLHLTGREATLLLFAMQALEGLADTPYPDARETLMAKVRSLIPEQQHTRVQNALKGLGFSVPRRLQRSPMLETLLAQVGQPCRLEYDSERGAELLDLRPVRLYTSGGFWYLEAEGAAGGLVLRVDRVRSVEPRESVEVAAGKPYSHPSHPLVRVHLTRKGARRVESDPHLQFQTPLSEPPYLLEFRCPPSELNWYSRYFGGMGADAVVESPDELIGLIKNHAEILVRLYR